MNAATIFTGALLTSTLLAACSAAPPSDGGVEASNQPLSAEAATGKVTPERWGHHPVCQDTNPSCTSTVRAPNRDDAIEVQLAHLCFFPPFDWHEWNEDSTHVYETFFLCPDTPALHAYVDPIGWSTVHTVGDACGVCVPPAFPGFTYVVTNRRETIPTCGNSCPDPVTPVKVW